MKAPKPPTRAAPWSRVAPRGARTRRDLRRRPASSHAEQLLEEERVAHDALVEERASRTRVNVAEVDRLLAEDGSDRSHAEIMEGSFGAIVQRQGRPMPALCCSRVVGRTLTAWTPRARLLRSDRRAARTGDRWREQLDRLPTVTCLPTGDRAATAEASEAATAETSATESTAVGSLRSCHLCQYHLHHLRRDAL